MHIRRLLRLATLVLVVLAAFAGSPTANAQDAARNGAGLVVRHGDGTLVYAYVEFDEETLSGEELLLRSGLDYVVAPYGGLGTGVCAINGEGCPADNCYCESYGSPAYYWTYFTRTDDGWGKHPRGPTSRQLADGAIDGWSWTAGEHGLPAVTIDEIAALTGFDRSPDPTATPPPTPTPAPATATPTELLLPSPPAPPATPVPPTPARDATETPTASNATATLAPTGTATPPTPTTTSPPSAPTATAPPPPTEVPSTSVPPATGTPTAAPSSTAKAATGAVVVRPGATPEALETDTSNSGADQRTLMLFGGFVTLVGAAGAVALLRRRRNAL